MDRAETNGCAPPCLREGPPIFVGENAPRFRLHSGRSESAVDIPRERSQAVRLPTRTAPPPIQQRGPVSSCVPHISRRIDGLEPHPYQFNASLCCYGGRLLLAYRLKWIHSDIWLCELDESFRPRWNRRVEIPQADFNALAVEDPRLFLFNGRLHLMYAGVGPGKRGPVISVCYCRLRDDFSVEANFCPHYVRRTRIEKNWQFFEHDGALLAVYSIRPHVVLEIDGDQARERFRETWRPNWSGGLLRGGASPVRRGDVFYSFFHGAADGTQPRTYTLGCYTFEARPPFRPQRITPQPLLEPDPADQPLPHMPHCVYPAGTMLWGDQWLISSCYYDHQVWLTHIPQSAVEGVLQPVSLRMGLTA